MSSSASPPAFNSYVKTTAACAAAAAVTSVAGVVGGRFLPGPTGLAFALACAVATLIAGVLTVAGFVVLLRARRDARSTPDLFLVLNAPKDARTIGAAAPVRAGNARRWLARRLLGHDLIVGDIVEVRPWAEIAATLDAAGCLEGLPFMREMLPMCGRRAVVFRCMHRLFDYRKTRRMRHMAGAVLLAESACDGSAHGGCDAACQAIWKDAWLKRVGAAETARPGAQAKAQGGSTEAAGDRAEPPAQANRLGGALAPTGSRDDERPRYACQLTALNGASVPVREWSIAEFVRPLVAGNVTPAAFAVGWLTNLFNVLQHHRQGSAYPALEAVLPAAAPESAALEKGMPVVVRPPEEIRATLSRDMLHRGLYFEPDMLKHCARQYRVAAEVRRIIDIVTGEMITMKTPAYILEDVRFSGERQLFNAQCEPLYWRSVWLRAVSK